MCEFIVSVCAFIHTVMNVYKLRYTHMHLYIHIWSRYELIYTGMDLYIFICNVYDSFFMRSYECVYIHIMCICIYIHSYEFLKFMFSVYAFIFILARRAAIQAAQCTCICTWVVGPPMFTAHRRSSPPEVQSALTVIT